jgi:hypothetical protein
MRVYVISIVLLYSETGAYEVTCKLTENRCSYCTNGTLYVSQLVDNVVRRSTVHCDIHLHRCILSMHVSGQSKFVLT